MREGHARSFGRGSVGGWWVLSSTVCSSASSFAFSSSTVASFLAACRRISTRSDSTAGAAIAATVTAPCASTQQCSRHTMRPVLQTQTCSRSCSNSIVKPQHLVAGAAHAATATLENEVQGRTDLQLLDMAARATDICGNVLQGAAQ